MGLEFRYAERKDTDLILSFIKGIAEYERMSDDVVADPAVLEEEIFDKKRAEVIFAQIDGKEIGFVFFYQTFPAYLGKGGIYIDDLYVDPEYRGKGYGKQMIKYMARTALERDCGRMEWCRLNWNQSSMDFYRSMGAIPLDECTIFRAPENVLKAIIE